MEHLEKVFTPGYIGTMQLKNRLVMSAMGTRSADKEGRMTDNTIDYYVTRAKGGVGLIVTQGTIVAHECRAPHIFAIYDDTFIPGFKKLTKAVRRDGAKIACQLFHPGVVLRHMWQGYEQPPELEVVGPSAIACVPYNVVPRELSWGEIKRLVNVHAEAALRVKKSGFDAVEINGAHGYFLGAFFSPFKNRRNDEYGGTVQNRVRFACEIVAEIKKKVGQSFPVIFRMNGSDFLKGGTTLEDTLIHAPLLVEAGADALSISAGTQETPWWRDLSYLFPDGAIVYLSEAVKKVVKIPVITVGKIGDLFLAESILREEKADFVAMARALLVDPDLPKKSREGRLEDIRRCIHCNNCRSSFWSIERVKAWGSGLGCTVNPEVLQEKVFALAPTLSPKKVMVIGGGLAGMEASRVLAERNHHVVLYEKEGKLGGQWNIACSQALKESFSTVTEYLARELAKTKAKVILNTRVTLDLLRKEKPDVVVVATGSSPIIPEIPGVNKKKVVQAIDVLSGKAEVGEKVAVIGGRLLGMEISEIIADRGKKVSLVTKNRLGENGLPIERSLFYVLRDRLIKKGVSIYPNSSVIEIRDDGIYVAYQQELEFLAADTVVLAAGAKTENRLLEEIKGAGPEVYAIGDCLRPRNAMDAIYEGAVIGRKI